MFVSLIHWDCRFIAWKFSFAALWPRARSPAELLGEHRVQLWHVFISSRVMVFSFLFSSLLAQTFCSALLTSAGIFHSKWVSVTPHGQEWKSINEHLVCFTNFWPYVYLCDGGRLYKAIHSAVWTRPCFLAEATHFLPTPLLLPKTDSSSKTLETAAGFQADLKSDSCVLFSSTWFYTIQESCA